LPSDRETPGASNALDDFAGQICYI